LARRCSRWGGGVVVAGLGSSVVWRCRRSRWSRCSRQRSSPSAPVRAPGSSLPAPRSRLLPLPARCGGGALLRWHVVGVPLWPRPSSARRSGGAPFFLPLTALSQEKRKGKTLMGLVAWTSGSLPPPSLLNHGTANGEAKTSSCPGFDRPGSRGSAAPPSCRLGCRGVWRGVKEVFPARAGFDSRVSTLRSLGVRAGRMGRVSRPAHARPRRGLPGAVRI
jgi:hypothetical protein